MIQIEVLILFHPFQRYVGYQALLFIGQEGVVEGFLFGVVGKEAGEGGADIANAKDYRWVIRVYGRLVTIKKMV